MGSNQNHHYAVRGNINKKVCLRLVILVLVLLVENGGAAARLERWESAIRMPTDSDIDQDQGDPVDLDQQLGTRWAVLVAGSSGYGNYRHQVKTRRSSQNILAHLLIFVIIYIYIYIYTHIYMFLMMYTIKGNFCLVGGMFRRMCATRISC